MKSILSSFDPIALALVALVIQVLALLDFVPGSPSGSVFDYLLLWLLIFLKHFLKEIIHFFESFQFHCFQVDLYLFLLLELSPVVDNLRQFRQVLTVQLFDLLNHLPFFMSTHCVKFTSFVPPFSFHFGSQWNLVYFLQHLSQFFLDVSVFMNLVLVRFPSSLGSFLRTFEQICSIFLIACLSPSFTAFGQLFHTFVEENFELLCLMVVFTILFRLYVVPHEHFPDTLLDFFLALILFL